MRTLQYLVIFFFFIAMPSTLLAGLRPGELPEASKWYLHVDFEEMRSSEAGRHLYDWLQDEVFADIREEVGLDLDKEADLLTAFSTAEQGPVIVIEGDISQDTKDKLLAMGAASGSLDQLEARGKAFYHIKDDGDDTNDVDLDIEIDSFNNGVFFSFAVENKLLVTASKERMQSLLAEKGKIAAGQSNKDALFVLSAERSLMQAGARADDLTANGSWNSNILRNTEQAALLLADKDGKIAIEAQLVTTEKTMADSLASIIRGLISLQIFNDDMDPEIAQFLQSTTVEVDDNTLKVSVALDPETVVAAIE